MRKLYLDSCCNYMETDCYICSKGDIVYHMPSKKFAYIIEDYSKETNHIIHKKGIEEQYPNIGIGIFGIVLETVKRSDCLYIKTDEIRRTFGFDLDEKNLLKETSDITDWTIDKINNYITKYICHDLQRNSITIDAKFWSSNPKINKLVKKLTKLLKNEGFSGTFEIDIE